MDVDQGEEMMYTPILISSIILILSWIAMIVYLIRFAKKHNQECSKDEDDFGLGV